MTVRCRLSPSRPRDRSVRKSAVHCDMKTVSIKALGRVAYARYGVPRNRCCPLCERHLVRFLPYAGGAVTQQPMMRELGVVGSCLEQFECPWCGASDRERHLWLYMQAADLTKLLSGAAVLHIAPEKRLSEQISALGPDRYVKGDLFPAKDDLEKIDILDTGYLDDAFDFVIANHVMEHVDDDLRAAAEIHRILKPGGHAILQTPYSPRLQHTWQDPGIDSDNARLLAFGQEDHVRLFGRDVFDRLASGGLAPGIRYHHELLGASAGDTNGVNAAEPLFLFTKAE